MSPPAHPSGLPSFGGLRRRRFLHQAGAGFLGSALGTLWSEAGSLRRPARLPGGVPRVRSVIFLFMCGGVSHIDTFDPKDNRWAGTLMDAVGFGDNLAEMKRPVIPCHRTFTRHGASGIPVSDWFPHVGGVIDEIAVVRSMWCHESNHFPAVIEMATGHRDKTLEYPCLGSWVTYALGTDNDNLPAFVNIGRPTSSVQTHGGFLGSTLAATPFQTGEVPVRNLQPPKGLPVPERDRQMQALESLNREFREAHALHEAIAARTRAYELAARMQLTAPEAVDFARETAATRALYGVDQPETDAFGRQLLLARRLVERGVRFIQICHAGGGNGGWDAHDTISSHAPLCRQTDQPIAGLIRDLKLRGLLDQTLVVWTSEFGRTPWSQNTVGRDHNPKGFTSWLAGGGVRGGMVYGATDEVGYRAVENRTYLGDLQATLLHQLGLDHARLEVEIAGRPVRLVEEGCRPIFGILG